MVARLAAIVTCVVAAATARGAESGTRNSSHAPAMDVIDANSTHYGNPHDSSCLADEIELKDLCAPRCTVDGSCPRDVPPGTTASPDCAIEEDNQRLCALVCVPAAAAAGCPDGASCKVIQGVGLCTYDDDATRRSFLRRA